MKRYRYKNISYFCSQIMIKYIADKDHYTEVLSHCEKVKHDLWIGTADLKDLYVPVPSPREGWT